MATHTKGPLVVSKHGTPEYAPQYGVHAGGADLAIVRGKNARANAYLFAAAPDMLDALEIAVNLLDTNDNDGRKAYAAVRDAINKATS
jgi:hypothetical protein